MTPEIDLLAAARTYLRRLGDAGPFLEALDQVCGTPAPFAPEDPPDMVQAPDWNAMASDLSRPLVAAMVRHLDRMSWIRPFGNDPRSGEGFAERAYATAFVGPWATLDANHVGAGFFYVGPSVAYLDHAHQQNEIYVPLAGRAVYTCDSYGRIEAGPDTVLHHPSFAWHSMATDGAPVMIFWVWIGEGLLEKPYFRGSDGEPLVIGPAAGDRAAAVDL